MIHELDIRVQGAGETREFDYIQCEKTKDYYIYEIWSLGNIVGYEVFHRKTVPICIDFENRIYSETELKEVYPKSKDFGVWAWTTSTKELAISKITESLKS